ncbi:MAG TPA: tyrosine--tRNA ligase [Erysipelotrichaceae bacterium]|nr:tyrosine--tRNA ligase [Erysipelotrichaceae bacterium]
MEFIDELVWRGLVKDVTDFDGLKERLKTPATVYCGFDPTADSLHVGHMQQIMLLKRYQEAGHRVIALCGGATGMIGDPRPTTERSMQSLDVIRENVVALQEQLSRFLNLEDSEKGVLLNNYDWLGNLGVLEFLRDYGKHFNVNYMLAKDTIASRLSTGISYTEFSYTILQSMDWLHLYKEENCEIQIGGSDQWGNLTSGGELIRKVLGDKHKVYGITSPLINKADGSKFGKSEGENIWLNTEYTNAYDFYQFWFNTPDSEIIDYMKRLSMKSPQEIMEFEKLVESEPHKRAAQIALAEELTILVHKQAGLERALNITRVLFGGDIKELEVEDIKAGLKDAPKYHLEESKNLVDLLVDAKIASSKREAREFISNNAIAINGDKTKDLDLEVSKELALGGELIVIKRGRRNYYIIEVEK